MTFKTTTTKKEQIEYIKKYSFFLRPKRYRIHAIFTFCILFIIFIYTLFEGSYLVSILPFFGILVCLYIVTSRINTLEYTATDDMNCVTKIEINDKEVIGIAPDKTVKEALISYTNFLVIKDGIFLITYSNNKKKKGLTMLFVPIPKTCFKQKQELIDLLRKYDIKSFNILHRY